MAELKHPIKEAERYLDNAKRILSEKAEKEGNYYNDRKYVRMAGDTAWKGALIALDAVFNVKKKPNHRVSIEEYKEAVAKRDRKLLACVNTGYQTLHLYMGYDGIEKYVVCQSGLEDAKNIIDWCNRHYTEKV